jgi:hypothetical protein
MTLKNLREGSRDPVCGCGSWIHHWENGSGRKKGFCCVIDCQNKADRGGHIQRKVIGDDRWYIIPICAKHNNQFGKELDIYDGTSLIPVSKSN